MTKKIPHIVAILLIVSFQRSIAQEQAIPYEVTLESSKQFWVSSNEVGDDFLIKVYLPDSYFSSASTFYPVIYLTDADRYFGMASDLVYRQLYDDNNDVILVGIGYGSRQKNNDKRGRDLNGQPKDNGEIGSERFLSFLVKELFPKIEPEFRIDASKRTLIGWSRGATFVLDMLFNQTELFSNYLALGPRLNYENWSVLEMEQAHSLSNTELTANLYIFFGAQDERYADLSAFIQKLESRNYEGFTFKSDVFQGHGHDVFAHLQGMASGFEYAFILESIGDVLLPVIDEQGVEQAISFYYQLRKTSPETYDFTENRLNELGYQLLAQKKYQEAIEIFQLNVEQFPVAFNVYDSLGEAYMLNGQNELAISNYRRSLELNPGNTNAKEMLKRLAP